MQEIDKRQMMADYPTIEKWVKTMPPAIISSCVLARYARGEALFYRGNEIQRVYMICCGTVLISTCDLDGAEKCVAFSEEGQTLGEMEALLRRKNLVYGAKAFTDCVMLEIPLSAFEGWVEQDESVCRNLMYALAQKLLDSSESTVQYQNLTARLRLVKLLAHHAPGWVRDTRVALAEACGVSERTIYRVVAELAADGALTLNRGKIGLSQAQIDRFNQLEFQK